MVGPINKEQARHEAYMYRLLAEILDDKYLVANSFFKGGTCARMLGYLDRFSVDLDFDIKKDVDKKKFREILYSIFKNLDIEIKDESKKALQFFLKYPSPSGKRNTVKIEFLDKIFKANKYESKYLSPIERTAMCQTIETMFGHKLIALIDRYEQGGSIAGRDVYDIHHFFLQDYDYNSQVIVDRRGVSVLEYFKKLREFVNNRITRKILEEDLNILLEYKKFKQVNKYLKKETLNFIDIEIKRLSVGLTKAL
jgi:predicted nucleotidyltransferase component of viral defense system